MSQWTYRWNVGTKVKSACYIWYIEGSDPATVVDAGAQGEHFGVEFPMSTRVSLHEGLKGVGLTRMMFRQVIVTHLHFDHIAWQSSTRTPNSSCKKELDFARNLHVFSAVDYRQSLFSDLAFRVVDGDTEILPGIAALLHSGHSPGGQSVQIGTRQAEK